MVREAQENGQETLENLRKMVRKRSGNLKKMVRKPQKTSGKWYWSGNGQVDLRGSALVKDSIGWWTIRYTCKIKFMTLLE